jgi:hypothetical protein
LNSNNLGKESTSQVWKDLQRDRIIINGNEVTGEHGAEAMVGALVRCISKNVDSIKSLDSNSSKNLKASTYNGSNPFHSHFSVNEAHIVECARDLLVLCNRTQSGGDTYFCVDSLLMSPNAKEFCILAPFSPEADPLEFFVDVVELQNVQFQNVRKYLGIAHYSKDNRYACTLFSL